MGERHPYKMDVGGSIPSTPTNCHESRNLHYIRVKSARPKSKIYEASSNLCGQILPVKSINEHMISNVLRKTMDFWRDG